MVMQQLPYYTSLKSRQYSPVPCILCNGYRSITWDLSHLPTFFSYCYTASNKNTGKVINRRSIFVTLHIHICVPNIRF